MIINNISIEGFRIIGNKIRIAFPKNGCIGVFGHNESGKSSILEAIEFGLFGLTRRTKEDLITWGKNNLNVSLGFSSGKKQYLIERTLNRKGSHKAKFSQLENGHVLENTVVNTVTAVEQQIEDVLGMDKNSYSNLIYIRQKELDALKDLQKHDRVKLINKVMGIEAFDSAAEKVLSDSKEQNISMKSVEQQLIFLKRNHDNYLKNLDQLKIFDIDIKKLHKDIEKKERVELEIKIKLNDYELKKEYQHKKRTLHSKESEKNTLSTSLKDLQTRKEKLENYQKVFEDIEPQYNVQKSLKEKFENIESEINTEENYINSLKASLPNSLKNEPDNVHKRTSSLKKGIGFLTGGILIAFLGIFTPFLIALGVIFWIISAVYLKRYRKLDKNLIQDVKNQEKFDNKKTHELTIKELKEKILDYKSEYDLSSSEEIGLKIQKLNLIVKTKTGLITVEELHGAISNLFSENKNSEIQELVYNIDEINSNINDLHIELKKIEDAKPSHLNLESDLDEFDNIKKDYDKIKEELEFLYSKLNKSKGAYDQLKNDCVKLVDDYKQYPIELEKKKSIEIEITLLDFLKDRFKEVSAKLRQQVIPLAVNLISSWLPKITDNRYSSLEISEDLKFSVYEDKVGEFKERDLFSGGTQDQFLIALRLAFTKSILDNRTRVDEYALFMDEATSSSDYIRKQGIFDLLDEVKNTFKQIFIIAHEDVSNSVDYHIILERDVEGFTSIKSRNW